MPEFWPVPGFFFLAPSSAALAPEPPRPRPRTAPPSHARYPPRPDCPAGMIALFRNPTRAAWAPPRENLRPSASERSPRATLS